VSSNTSIYAGSQGRTAWVRIEGDATKDTAGGLRRYLSETFSSGLRNFIIDLKDCKKVDSTFIGILVGLAKQLDTEEAKEGKIRLLHANSRNSTSITKLGLHNRIDFAKNGRDFEELESQIGSELKPLPEEEMDKFQKSKMVLKAHEDLCDANEENEGIFSDLLFYLRRDLKKSSEG
jgi:anti-sigma B factor antagonist